MSEFNNPSTRHLDLELLTRIAIELKAKFPLSKPRYAALNGDGRWVVYHNKPSVAEALRHTPCDAMRAYENNRLDNQYSGLIDGLILNLSDYEVKESSLEVGVMLEALRQERVKILSKVQPKLDAVDAAIKVMEDLKKTLDT